MPDVQPGDVTGVYYIVVAGLPWNCSWQKLKDFCRNQQRDGSFIDIDHAYVYPESTDGWARVKGKKNFLKAMGKHIFLRQKNKVANISPAHLQRGILDHRCLLVDGRNETEVTTLRECVIQGVGSPRRRAPNERSPSSDTVPSPSSCYWGHQSTASTSTYSESEGV